MTCKLCGGDTQLFGELIVLGHHRARYLRCEACSYVFVEAPDWLDEAYADHAITALDTGIVVRNLWLADAVDALLRWRFRKVRIRTARTCSRGVSKRKRTPATISPPASRWPNT